MSQENFLERIGRVLRKYYKDGTNVNSSSRESDNIFENVNFTEKYNENACAESPMKF